MTTENLGEPSIVPETPVSGEVFNAYKSIVEGPAGPEPSEVTWKLDNGPRIVLGPNGYKPPMKEPAKEVVSLPGPERR